MKTYKNLLLLTLIAFIGCKQKEDFFKLPDVARLEYGQVLTAPGQDWKVLSTLDIGRKPFGSMSRVTLYAKNLGTLPASIKRVWIEGEHPEYFSYDHKCTRPLGQHEICSLHVYYEPTTVGSTPASLNIAFSDGSGTNAVKSLPISAGASNLAFLKFEQEKMDIKTNTIGYTLSSYFKVLYNGSSLAVNGFTIEPAKGVIISDPTDGSFTIDRSNSTCGEVIQSDCVVKVNFSPVAEGAVSSTFNLNYFNGAEVLKINGEASGTGLKAAILASLTANAVDFGNVVVNPPAASVVSVPVVFAGSVPADNIVIKGPNNAAFSIDSDASKTTCKKQINGTCALSVKYNPSALGAQSDSITIEYTSNGQTRTPLKISLKGTGVQPASLASNLQAIAFGTAPAYKTITKPFTLTNSGDVAISQLSALAFSNAVDFSGSFEAKCATLAAKGTCLLNVNYKSKTAALASGDVIFSYFNGRETKSLKLSLSGTSTSPLVIEGARTIDFGNIIIGNPTLPASANVGLAIYGLTALTNASQLVINPSALASPFAFTAASTPGTTSNCKAPLDPKKANSCAFGVSLITNTGLAADVAVTKNFSISYTGDNGSGSGSLAFIAKMTPRLAPSISVGTIASVNPVSVGNSANITISLKNNSAYFATAFRSVAVEGSTAFTLASSTCSTGLAANASCSISVKFNPKDIGTFTAKLKYVYSDQVKDQTLYADLSAVGSGDLTLAASATTIDFGSVYVGDVIAAKLIDIKYYGKSNWTNTISVAAPFKITAVSCGTPVDCKLKVEYEPSVAGVSSVPATFKYSPALDKVGTINLTLKGTALLRAPSLSVSPSTLAKTLVGLDSTQVLTIKNTGNTIAQDITMPALQGVVTYSSDGAQGSAGNCAVGQDLKAGESCTVKVIYSPTKVGKAQVDLNVGYSLGTAKSVFAAKLNVIGTQMIQVFAGGFQTCIINEIGQVNCWGRNSSGQLGQGSKVAISKKPIEMPAVAFEADVIVKKLAVGDAHTCAIVSDGKSSNQVVCWGSNANGRLGIGSTVAQLLQPTNSKLMSLVNLGVTSSGDKEEILEVAAGFEHTCALTKTGKVKCWGGNTSGQLGIGNNSSVGTTAAQMSSMKTVALGRKAVGISAGAGHSCAVLDDGSSKCWGDNFYGQLGSGLDAEKIGTRDGEVANLSGINLGNFQVKRILASNGAFTCALSTSGEVKCFGKTVSDESSKTPFYGVLGSCWARPAQNSGVVACSSDAQMQPTTSIGYLSSDMGEALNKVSLGNFSVDQISVGSNFTCALSSDRQVKCWGVNDQGQLGIGSRVNVGDNLANLAGLKPILGVDDGSPVQIATGYEHACAVLKNNTMKCWGSAFQNATGLSSLGVAGNSGVSAATIPSKLPIAYDAR